MNTKLLALSSLVALVAACGSSSTPDTVEPSGSDGGTASDASADDTDAATGGDDAASADPFDGVPVGGDPLGSFLRKELYKDWTSQAAVHDSQMGPHGRIRTYFNDKLAASLSAGGAKHPRGSIAVKETYDASDVQVGWAVSMKVDDDSASGAGWHWFELKSNLPGERASTDAKGASDCAPCHSGSPTDFVFSKL